MDTTEHVALVQGLATLPIRSRAAVVLHYYADLPVAEVAAVMGTSQNTVKSQLTDRARATARAPRHIRRVGRPRGGLQCLIKTLDTRVESLLREALKAEAASLPLRVTSDHVLDRASTHPGWFTPSPPRDCRWRSRPAPPQS